MFLRFGGRGDSDCKHIQFGNRTTSETTDLRVFQCAHHLNATTVVSRWRLPSVMMQLSDEVVYR